MIRSLRILPVLAIAAAFVVSASQVTIASSAGGTMTVNATVSDNCVVANGTVAFGTYDTINAGNDDQSGTFTVAAKKVRWSVQSVWATAQTTPPAPAT